MRIVARLSSDQNQIQHFPFIFPLILLFLLLTFCLPCTGNSTERVFRLNNESTEGNSVFPLADGYLVLTNHNAKQNFTKFGILGDVVFSKDFYDAWDYTIDPSPTEKNGWPHSSVQTSDGGYLVAGLINPRPQKGYVIKLSGSMGFQWGGVFSHEDPSLDMWVAGAKETTDGGYVVLVKGQYINKFVYNPFWGVVKLDSSGDIAWQKRINVGAQTEVYDIHEISNAYVIYGGVDHPTYDWDLYFAAVTKDGSSILWQFILGGTEFDGAYTVEPVIYPHASPIVQVDAGHLAVAAYTKSYGVNPSAGDTVGKSVVLILFPLSGNAYTKMAILDGPQDDMIAGPYGGLNFIRLSDGYLLLGGYTTSTWSSPYSAYPGAFVVKLTPMFDSILWQNVHLIRTGKTSYESGLTLGLFEAPSGEINVVGKTDEEAFLFNLTPSGESESSCTIGFPTDFTLSDVSPTVATLTDFALSDGLVHLESISTTPSDTTVTLTCYSDLSISPSPLDHDFGDIPVGSTSAPLEITISNSSGAVGTLVMSAVNFVGGDWTEFKGNLGTCQTANYSLDPGESCEMTVWFQPSSVGEKSTTIEIITNDPETPRWTGTVRGKGIAVGPVVEISGSGNFGSVAVSATSPAHAFAISNTGNGDLVISSIGIVSTGGSPIRKMAGDADMFHLALGTCPSLSPTLPEGTSCTLQITFQPTSPGGKNATLRIISNSTVNPTLDTGLSGTGIAPNIQVTGVAEFGSVLVNSTSPVHPFTISNTGDADLVISSIGVTGDDTTMFGVDKSACPALPATLAPGSNCAVNVTFSPSSKGDKKTTLRILSDSFANPDWSTQLTGTGTQPDISVIPSSIPFGGVLVGSSKDETVTVQNVGAADLHLGTISSPEAPFTILAGSSCTNGKTLTSSGGSCAIIVRFTPTGLSGSYSSFDISSDDPDDSTVTVSLSGVGTQPDIKASPSDLPFGDVVVGAHSDWQMAIHNLGTADLHIGTIGSPALPFSRVEGEGTCVNGMTLSPGGGSCTLTIRFAPSTIGPFNSSFNVTSDDPDGPVTVTVRGTGVAPNILVTGTFDFGAVAVGSSLRRTLSIANNGTSNLAVSSITITDGDADLFALATSSCPNLHPNLEPGQDCTIFVTFSPTSTGNKGTTLRIVSDSLINPTLEMPLTGSGENAPNIQFSGDDTSFGEVAVGSSSSPHTFIISNNGAATLEVSSMELTGGSATMFQLESGTCPSFSPTLMPGSNCTILATFSPSSTGPKNTFLRIVSNSLNDSTLNIQLNGTGIAVPEIELSGTVDFGSVPIGTSSAQTFTISNTGNADLVVNSIEVTGFDASMFSVAKDTCPSLAPTLGAGASCKLSVTFSPTGTGPRKTDLRIISNASNDPTLTATLNGKGVNFLIQPAEGTIGTEIVLTGCNFGAAKGKVLVGDVSLKVLEWTTGTSIKALFAKAMAIDTPFDVVVQPKVPKGADPIKEENVFTMRAPEITAAPEGGKSGDVTPLTIKGNFFSNKKGKVTLEYDVGATTKSKSCKVLIWPTDSASGTSLGEIQFTVPKGLAPGDAYTLRISNKVGSDTVPFKINP